MVDGGGDGDGGHGGNVGAVIIRIRCWGIFYSKHNKAPPPPQIV